MSFEYWVITVMIITVRFILGVRKDFKEIAEQRARDAHNACFNGRTNGRNQS